MLIKCPECGEQISDQVEACPKCGIPNPAARAALSNQEQKGHRRRKLFRAVAIVLALFVLTAGGTVIYLWRFSVQHDILSYEVGPVTGTSKITQQHFVNVVKGVVRDWNKAAGKTIMWGLPFGRTVQISLSTDQSIKDYGPEIALLETAALEAKAYYDLILDRSKATGPGFHAVMLPSIVDDMNRTADDLAAARVSKDTNINGWKPLATALASSETSLAIINYIDDADLRALLSHALGHVLGLSHSSGDNVMNNSGRSTTITEDLAVEAAAGH